MKKIKVWIATISLLLVLTTMVLPTHALADPPDPQGPAQPAPPPPPPPPDLITILIRILLSLF